MHTRHWEGSVGASVNVVIPCLAVRCFFMFDFFIDWVEAASMGNSRHANAFCPTSILCRATRETSCVGPMGIFTPVPSIIPQYS